MAKKALRPFFLLATAAILVGCGSGGGGGDGGTPNTTASPSTATSAAPATTTSPSPPSPVTSQTAPSTTTSQTPQSTSTSQTPQSTSTSQTPQSTTSVTLAWNPNTDPDLAGYKIYESTSSGTYGAAIATVPPSTTSFAVTGLQRGVTYYFVITAYDTSGNESARSAEVRVSL
jgi:hypothetical protein